MLNRSSRTEDVKLMFWLNNMTSEGRMLLIKYILSSALLANLRFICFAQSDWRILTMKITSNNSEPRGGCNGKGNKAY